MIKWYQSLSEENKHWLWIIIIIILLICIIPAALLFTYLYDYFVHPEYYIEVFYGIR